MKNPCLASGSRSDFWAEVDRGIDLDPDTDPMFYLGAVDSREVRT